MIAHAWVWTPAPLGTNYVTVILSLSSWSHRFGLLWELIKLTRVKHLDLPCDSVVETCQQCRRHKRCRLDPWVGQIPWRKKWQPTPVFLPGKFHGQGSLEGSLGLQRVGHEWATGHIKHLAQDPGLIQHSVSVSHYHPYFAGCYFFS